MIVANNDKQLIADIYNEYYPLFHKKANVFVTDRYIAEDILQDSFVKVLRNTDKIAHLEKKEQVAYICQIIVNTGIDYIKNIGKNEVENYNSEEELPVCEEVTPEQVIIINEDKKLSRSCMNKLSVADRQLILMYFYEDMEITEISKILHIKEGATRTKISRAKKRLIKLVQKEMKNNER